MPCCTTDTTTADPEYQRFSVAVAENASGEASVPSVECDVNRANVLKDSKGRNGVPAVLRF